jgi:hypothetical protein
MKTIIIITLFLLLLSPAALRAEPFWDFYGGAAFTEDEDVTATIQSFPFFGPTAVFTETREVSFDTSVVLGLRGGRWFPGDYEWLGLAFDISYFQADADRVDVDLVPLSALLMFRYPMLRSDAYPRGLLQPYAGIGFAAIIGYAEVDFRPFVPEKVDGLVSGFGPDFRLGMAWQAFEGASLFTEDRHLRASLDNDGYDSDCFFSCDAEDFDIDIRTHHVLLGVRFSF